MSAHEVVCACATCVKARRLGPKTMTTNEAILVLGWMRERALAEIGVWVTDIQTAQGLAKQHYQAQQDRAREEAEALGMAIDSLGGQR